MYFIMGEAPGVAAPTDPYASDVLYLNHFNGTEGSTTMVDESGHATSHSVFGHAAIDADISFLGGQAIYFDGLSNAPSNTYDGVGTSGPYNELLGSLDAPWTAELQVKQDGTQTNNSPIVWMLSNISQFVATIVYSKSTDKYYCLVKNAGGADQQITLSPVDNSLWHALALTYDGTTLRMYIDGTLGGTKAMTTLNTPGAIDMTFGRYAFGLFNLQGFKGWMKEARLTKNVARYTGASYAVQTAQFPYP